MTKKTFRKWARENREALVRRFELEGKPRSELAAVAKLPKKGSAAPRKLPGTGTLVQLIMKDDYPHIPQGFNVRKACRAAGIPTVLMTRPVIKKATGEQKKMLALVPTAAL